LKGRVPSVDEKKIYRTCRTVMDDVTDENMDMLESIGAFLGRLFTGKIENEHWQRGNVLKRYLEEYVLKRKEVPIGTHVNRTLQDWREAHKIHSPQN
jgi:hypothetical protein